jgi:hypothetical protein
MIGGRVSSGCGRVAHPFYEIHTVPSADRLLQMWIRCWGVLVGKGGEITLPSADRLLQIDRLNSGPVEVFEGTKHWSPAHRRHSANASIAPRGNARADGILIQGNGPAFGEWRHQGDDN